MPHSDRIPHYLQQILKSIEFAQRYLADRDLPTFEHDTLLQDAVFRRLEIIGEAARRIEKADENFIGTYPQLQLNKAYGMRNRLSHAYDAVNVELVWDVVHQHLPGMAQAIQDFLQHHPRSER
jgi:uncharacterized protein with HEPN domain